MNRRSFLGRLFACLFAPRILLKRFPGGRLQIPRAQIAGPIRRKMAPFLYADEVDSGPYQSSYYLAPYERFALP